jgi:hypothetical protein
MDTGVSLSRSEYFCIVHDDDFLAKHHLKCMTDVLCDRPDISYLSCSNRSFNTENEAIVLAQSKENSNLSYSLVFYPPKSTCVGCYAGWLGALINREQYIDMGGMLQPVSTGIGDFIMVMQYTNKYAGTYCIKTKEPLYFYRISAIQASAGGVNMWLKGFSAEYILYRYLAKRHHPFFTFFWNYLASIIIHDKIRNIKKQAIWTGGASVDTADLERLVGLPACNGRGIRYKMGKILLKFIRRRYIKNY